MSIQTLAGLAGVAAFAATASAQFTASQFAPRDLDTGGSGLPRGDATGDLVETALTVFGPTMSSFYDMPIFHSIGSTETFGVATNVEVTSSIVDNGDGTRTMTISWLTNDGSALFGPNAFGTEPVTTLGFEMGRNNTPNDIVEDPDYTGIADPDNLDGMGMPGMDGIFESSFELFGADGSSLFTGTFFVEDFGTGFGGTVFVSAGGADLGTLNIGGGVAVINYNAIPSPGAAALLGISGLVAARRRR